MYSMNGQILSILSSLPALTRRFHPPRPLKLSFPSRLTGMAEIPTGSGLTLDCSGSDNSAYVKGQLRMNTTSPLVKAACASCVV